VTEVSTGMGWLTYIGIASVLVLLEELRPCTHSSTVVNADTKESYLFTSFALDCIERAFF